MKRNYQKELEQVLGRLDGKTPRLLLHSCCAPCSSYVLEYLSQYFQITVRYFNPNISPAEEYQKRLGEQARLIEAMPMEHKANLQSPGYEPAAFYEAVKGLEQIPEGGERCFACFALRLEDAAKAAKEGGFDYFTTTLSISPLKNAQKLNEIGEAMGEKHGVKWLPGDFKKKEGYKRSIVLSEEYGLYRQNYCGCAFSKKEAMEREEKKKQEASGHEE